MDFITNDSSRSWFSVLSRGLQGITALTVPEIIYSRKMKDQECALFSCQNARFGYAIAPIGDVDRDGFPGSGLVNLYCCSVVHDRVS